MRYGDVGAYTGDQESGGGGGKSGDRAGDLGGGKSGDRGGEKLFFSLVVCSDIV